MSFKLTKGSYVDMVALKVMDLENEIKFYQEVLGLDILREENGMAFMGVKATKKTLLCLIEQEAGKVNEDSRNGLYHLALLVPSRKDLSEIYQHLLKLNYPIVGLSDQGHSEAIFIKDSEYNGIKIYCDKPQSEWDYHTEGPMDSILNRLDSESLLKESQEVFEKLPGGTYVGHVHLNVVDLEKSQYFYEKMLGLNLTSKAFPSLRYLAVADYHQHIAMNTFNQVTLGDHDDDNFGLDYISFKVTDLATLEALNTHLNEFDVPFYYNKGKKVIQIDDPNKIHILFHVDVIKK